jgi:UDP-2-acetamido-2,6-beta-L-arabino-hexul-4-ose reductase
VKILITGAKGFIGKNLVAALESIRDGKDKTYHLSPDIELLCYDKDSGITALDSYCKELEFVIHLAGVNRPKDTAEFMQGNYGFTYELLQALKKHSNKAPILVTSSIQAELCNPYGESKKESENTILNYGLKIGVNTFIYRLPNVFGKWCRPNYNSAIATFCYNISRDMPITVNDPNILLRLVYIDDIVSEIIYALEGHANRQGTFCAVQPVYHCTLGEAAEKIKSFHESRTTLSVPDMSDGLTRKLYATYLSYMPEDQFSFPLKMNIDSRGSFTEIIRTADRGQFSVNVTKPGTTKGNHWHNTKNEKFLVVSGQSVIRFRKVGESEVYSYFVSGGKMEVVDIPPGYIHNITNTGTSDLVTFMWANEPFNSDNPDTFFMEI